MSNIIGLKKFNGLAEKSDQDCIDNALNKNGYTENISICNRAILGYKQVKDAKLQQDIKQPFFDTTGRYSIVLDGEIYNFQELKNDLLKIGITFQSSLDIEVLLYHIIQNGEKGINALRGSFSFVFYDSKEDELLLVRDHLGIKPLLFSIQDKEIFFASELFSFKGLVDKLEVNPKALNAYFQYTYIPAPDTILLSVHKLLPGHYLKVKGDTVDILRYYSVRDAKNVDISYEDSVKEVRRRLEKAVIERLDSNQQIGTFLSGGVDSSVVSQITSTQMSELNTFSIGFLENEFFDESKYAENVAKHIHSNHHLIQLGKDDVSGAFSDVLSAFDEPYADSSVVAMYFLMQKTKEKVNICLSGDGADELFAGYNKHKAYQRSKNPGALLKLASKLAGRSKGGNRRGKISNRIRQLKKFNHLLHAQWPNSYWMLAQHISKGRRDNLLLYSKTFQNHIVPGDNKLRDFLFTDQEFVLPNDMLKKVDVMARYHDFVVRTPFLDVDFVDFVNGLADEYRIKGNVGKRVLRDAFRDTLPDEVFSRSKRGFEIPLHSWIKSVWVTVVNKDWFEKDYLKKQGLFSFEGAKQLKVDFDKGTEEEATVMMWAYIVFQNWYERWTKK